MESTTQASMTTSSGESGKIHRRDKGEMRAEVISNSNAHRLGQSLEFYSEPETSPWSVCRSVWPKHDNYVKYYVGLLCNSGYLILTFITEKNNSIGGEDTT